MKKHAYWCSALLAGSMLLTGCAPMEHAARVLNLSSLGTTPVMTPTTSPTATSANTALVASGSTHRVEAGDTIYNISQRYGVEGQALMRLNHITDPTSLSIGQVLMIPAGGQVVTQAADRGRVQVREARFERDTTPVAKPAPVVTSAPVAPVRTISKPVSTPVGTSAETSRLMWPVDGKVTDKGQEGIEIQAPTNSVVVSGLDGDVLYAQVTRGYGLLILIRSKFDDKVVVAYSHLKDATVKAGDVVRMGQKIGVVDDTGAIKMEIRVAGKVTPVMSYMQAKR